MTATKSPPRTTVIAPLVVASAGACAITSVPPAAAGISKTPIGPFQTTVPAWVTISANFARAASPTSTPISFGPILRTSTCKAFVTTGSHAVGEESDRRAEQLMRPLGHRPQRVFADPLPVGPAQVAHQDEARPVREHSTGRSPPVISTAGRNVRLMTGVGERSGQLGDKHAQPPASE